MGKIICAGLGPGDPDLMSVRADRAIRGARQIAYFRKKGREGQARRIVAHMLRPDVAEHAMEYPVTTEIPFDSPEYNRLLSAFYDDWTARLAALAEAGDIVVLCEGDPLFYGSFMHLHARLQGLAVVEIIPGIPGMTGCWNVVGQPMTWGDDAMCVLMGTLPEGDLTRHIRASDAVVVMKTGRNLPKIARAIAAAGRMSDAWLVERGTMPNQRIMPLAQADLAACPYFATVLVHGNGRRPLADAAE
ncbi:precorrin-2 C20-methyltransferase [Paracoccus halophilus]|uniref:Precorrin-2 C20-methyltransferase n=1 Tax=Paracoccus halophilus TaxID=376733 RepID=A0A099F3U9_9RHOB|nr:precorrin-2 C(20)-methyltransferase [Paracoccus halophilus]KGJ05390.1 precorrin-2 C20-methyltransferase [Paracoccus halophilus]SFA49018.1 precorrin-2 C20-methyltransferase [Paracoccus halophilus]